jgi:ergothioneine biosynthesis protein EgtB
VPLDAQRHFWRQRFRSVRAETEARAAPLSPEDQIVQSMPDASPTKWHRAHVTWFFEQFLVVPNDPDYRNFDERFPFLFNSYYVAAGPRHARPQRGLITRPNGADVTAYRAHVDAAVERLIDTIAADQAAEFFRVLEIGLHHEQQHQELLLTDILHAFAQNPTLPAYDADWQPPRRALSQGGYADLAPGIHAIGHQGDDYCFDNETPCHNTLVQDARIARQMVGNAQWLNFIADGGYRTPSLWLSDGWASVQSEAWQAPGYWQQRDGEWFVITLAGLRPVDPDAPACHQLLRGRRIRTMGRQASAQRAGVGSRGARRPARRRFRLCLAMDAQRLSALSRLSRRSGRAWRIQRQIHGQPDGVARLLAGDAGWS